MQTYAKKKLEFVVETALMPRLVRLVEEQGAKGFTVVPTQAGESVDGAWQRDDIAPALGAQMLIVVVDPAVADPILEAAYALLADYRAQIFVSDVEVLRQDRF